MLGLPCFRSLGDGDDRIVLYDAFTAASVLARFQGDFTGVDRELPPTNRRKPPYFASRCKPPPSSLWHRPPGSNFSSFSMTELPTGKCSVKTIDGTGRQFMIKFTYRYSCVDISMRIADAHQLSLVSRGSSEVFEICACRAK